MKGIRVHIWVGFVLSRFRETTAVAALLKVDNKTALMEQQIANQLVGIESLHCHSDNSRAALAKENDVLLRGYLYSY